MSLLPRPLPGGLPQKKDQVQQPAQAPFTYSPYNPDEIRSELYNNVLSAAQSVQPMINKRHTLSLSNVRYADDPTPTLDDEKDAILSNRSLGRRLLGTWTLSDNATGKQLDTRTSAIASVPHMTPRGTFIVNGVEYTVNHQKRQKPGIYARVKKNGEIESHANILGGDGAAHRYFLDPAKSTFHVNVSQAKIPLMPLLKAMGVTDQQMQDAWGHEIWRLNKESVRDNGQAIQKYFERMVGDRDRPNFSDYTQGVLAAFAKMKLDPYVSRKTLGYETDKLDSKAILTLTKKLVGISRGEQAPDNRDDLHYQTVVGPAELFAERITKDYGRMRADMFRKASLRGNLSGVPANALSRQLQTVILNSGLANALEEINPGETLDKLSKITSMGEGGLGSVDAIPDSARNVQNSYYGLIDPARTVESLRVGIDGNLTSAIRRGRDGTVYAEMQNVRTGKPQLLSAEQMSDSVLALPGELNKKTKRVIGIRNGELTYVNRADVDYVLPNFERAFSPLGNMVPFKSAMKVHRTTMASRMLTQALPLTKGEAPLVQTGVPDEPGESYENKYGTYFGAIRADRPGRVLAAGGNRVKVQYDDGEQKEFQLYNNFPLNRKTVLHHTPVVQPGDTFQPGQTLAKSNFTDDKGTAAIGVNLRAGYMAYDGYNFEDANVISRAAAKKLTSEHGYQTVATINPDKTIDKKQFLGYYPTKFSKSVLAKLDDKGVIKVGEAVNYGEPLVLGLQKRDLNHNRIVGGRQGAFTDATETWDHTAPGIVTDVKFGKKGITVVVKALSETEESDKLSGRFGDKGVISKIVEDEDMPVGADGQPLEILLNPLGLNSRVNVSQVVEAALGKVAAKTGQPYRLADFDKIEDASKFAFDELKKHDLSLYETVYDPRTGRKIPNIMVGNRWMMKLHHQGEGKSQARSTGGYSADGSPAKGGDTGAKRLSLLDSSALLAHGAFKTLRDSALVRGQRNEDYWLAFMQGKDVPVPKVPEVYKSFVAKLKGSGINVVEDGPKTNFMALTDADIDELSEGREIENGETVQFEKDMRPVKGGLFDPSLTGGPGGNRWAHIKLPEPMPSPAMEEPVRRLLGLTQKQFDNVLAGREKMANGKTGPQGIADSLGSLNIDHEITRANDMIASGKRSKRDEAVRKLKYLEAAKRLDIHPKDWLLTKVPVIPPNFRPVSQLGEKKLPMVADVNLLYRELLDAKDNFNNLQGQVADLGDERAAIYSAFKAITGLGDPVHPKLVEKNVRGLLAGIFGSSPKHGAVQRSLLSNTVDLVGRGVVIPNPDYDMDTIGIPEDKAWELYRFFAIRRLRRKGMPLTDAIRNVKDKTELARSELVKELEERPVRMVRAPVLHKFGIMAFKPRLVKGHGIQVSPLIVKPYGMDFDGDAVQYHVAATDDEKQEALERLLPSKNLISPANFKSPAYQPSQEYVGGLYTASAGESQDKPRRVFATPLDAWRAFKRGDISVTDPITILRSKT